jgi:hypothetical protein
MMQGSIADAWLKVAFEHWMFACGRQSHMREPTAQLVEQMHQAVRNENHAAAAYFINSLKDLANRFSLTQTGSLKLHTYETAETRVECARAAYAMGDKPEAIQSLIEASTRYTGQDHWRAVVLWMLGCIQWQLPTRVNEAIFSWETSCDLFRSLEGRSDRVEHAKWYAYWCEKMRLALDRAVDGYFDGPPPKSEWPKFSENSGPGAHESVKEAKEKPENKASENADSEKKTDFLRTYFVYESIPAGRFEPALTQTWERLEINRVLINQVAHTVHCLREGGAVDLGPDTQYAVVRVKSDSMNLKNIENGDYVLLQVRADAVHGDIVAVELDGGYPEDERYALKQFFRRQGRIVLEPKSTNDKHKPFSFSENDPSLRIRGVAIAVLKQVK